MKAAWISALMALAIALSMWLGTEFGRGAIDACIYGATERLVFSDEGKRPFAFGPEYRTGFNWAAKAIFTPGGYWAGGDYIEYGTLSPEEQKSIGE